MNSFENYSKEKLLLCVDLSISCLGNKIFPEWSPELFLFSFVFFFVAINNFSCIFCRHTNHDIFLLLFFRFLALCVNVFIFWHFIPRKWVDFLRRIVHQITTGHFNSCSVILWFLIVLAQIKEYQVVKFYQLTILLYLAVIHSLNWEIVFCYSSYSLVRVNRH